MTEPPIWAGTIHGEPASKANSRELVTIGGRPRFIKSKKARDYARDALKQIRRPADPIVGEVTAEISVWYATQRPDLDESIILDVLQEAGVYVNDRQVRERHVYHYIDKARPRATIRLWYRGQHGIFQAIT